MSLENKDSYLKFKKKDNPINNLPLDKNLTSKLSSLAFKNVPAPHVSNNLVQNNISKINYVNTTVNVVPNVDTTVHITTESGIELTTENGYIISI